MTNEEAKARLDRLCKETFESEVRWLYGRGRTKAFLMRRWRLTRRQIERILKGDG